MILGQQYNIWAMVNNAKYELSVDDASSGICVSSACFSLYICSSLLCNIVADDASSATTLHNNELQIYEEKQADDTQIPDEASSTGGS